MVLYYRCLNGNIIVLRSLSQRKTTSLNVIIMVEDKNDPPIPSYDSSIYFISENTFPGTTISTLSATDPDHKQQVSFELVETTTPFNISSSGALSLTESLNFEDISIYKLHVKVSDDFVGNPCLRQVLFQYM